MKNICTCTYTKGQYICIMLVTFTYTASMGVRLWIIHLPLGYDLKHPMEINLGLWERWNTCWGNKSLFMQTQLIV